MPSSLRARRHGRDQTTATNALAEGSELELYNLTHLPYHNYHEQPYDKRPLLQADYSVFSESKRSGTRSGINVTTGMANSSVGEQMGVGDYSIAEPYADSPWSAASRNAYYKRSKRLLSANSPEVLQPTPDYRCGKHPPIPPSNKAAPSAATLRCGNKSGPNEKR